MAGSLLRNMQRISAPLLQSSSRRKGASSVEYLPQPRKRLDETVILWFGVESETVRLNRTLRLIGMLAAVLGLLGTVLGMLVSFEVIQLHGTSQPRLLAGGIGQALMTTQAGLWTAVPVLFFHHIIRSRLRLISNEMEIVSHILQTVSSGKEVTPPDKLPSWRFTDKHHNTHDTGGGNV